MNQLIENIKSDETDSNETHKQHKLRIYLFALLAATVAAAAVGGWSYWEHVGSRYVSTDNAYTAAEVAQMTAEVAGLIAEIRVIDSQKVKRDDILVVIDDTDARLAMKQAEAQLEGARAQLAAAKSNQKRAKIDLKRRQSLMGSGSVSADELTRVKSGAHDANASVDAAHAAVALAQAGLDKAKVDFSRTVIRSPVDGVIARRLVQLGQRVMPSTPLLSVVPVQEMYVNANFKEVQLEGVHPGQKVELVSDLYGSKVVYHGVIYGFNGGTGAAFSLIPAQNATGNWIKVVQRLPVRISLDPAELQAHPLRVGLSMTATIDLRSKS
ncbi:HlyD family secretion protein [Mariprofundus erugo]|uniref:HlyD family secretion protein n=1 Tax=Mariprofundus erugo TaxID=2528639 RepID=UPI0010FD8CB2|nr:HlyD family secretion protein [Mariprofundus erugo]TLS75095.1 HlyD family secretion protein [Mariprofundus erugo]